MTKKLLWILLILEYGYIFGFLLNYDNAWMHPEKTMTHWWIVDNGSTLKWEDLKRGIDIRVIELGQPRVTRPFSNLFEMLDAKFRVWLWRFIPPHPSLSLSWPIFFILVPFLLFKFFRNIGCRDDVSLGGVCLYLASVGFLGPIIMMFHPGKNFVNLFAVLTLYLASRLQCRMQADSISQRSCEFRIWWCSYLILFSCVFLAFFWDETGLFIFILIGAFFTHSLFLKTKPVYLTLGLYLMLPILYYIVITFILPAVHQHLFNINTHISNYHLIPSLKDLLFPDLHNLLTNILFLFSDHLHINALRSVHTHHALMGLSMVYLMCIIFMITIMVGALIKYVRRRNKPCNIRRFYLYMLISLALFFIYSYFQTFQLSHQMGGGKVWGTWWYGNCFSLIFNIFFTITIAFLLESYSSKAAGWVAVAILNVCTIESLVFTTYRNNIFKIQNVTHDFDGREITIFSGGINQYRYYDFHNSLKLSQQKLHYIKQLWETVNNPRPSFLTDKAAFIDESQCLYLNNTKAILDAELLKTSTNSRSFILLPNQLNFADINGDKKADALYWDTLINDRGYFSVGLSKGTDFAKLVLCLAYPVEAKTITGGRRMRYADVNGDGLADVLYVDTAFTHTVWISLSTGSSFTQPVQCLPFDMSAQPEQVQFADVNGDSKSDAIFLDTQKGNGIWVSLSSGKAFPRPTVWTQPGKIKTEQIQFADVNGDKKADMIYYDPKGSNGLWVGLSTGAAFTHPTQWAAYGTSSPEWILLADVNGDGKADALYYNKSTDKGVRVSLSTGLEFTQPSCWLKQGRSAPQAMRFADVNGDGKADAVFVNPLSHQIEICVSTGDHFVEPLLSTGMIQKNESK